LACLAVFRTAKIGLYWTYTKKIVENISLLAEKEEIVRLSLSKMDKHAAFSSKELSS
jgi:hypothetical protein